MRNDHITFGLNSTVGINYINEYFKTLIIRKKA